MTYPYRLAREVRQARSRRLGELYVKIVTYVGLPALFWFGVWQFFIR